MNASTLFDCAYFNGGGKVGGYAREGLWDYPVHHFTAARILAEKPASVLELGCARGYLIKRIEAAGIPARGLEVSRHCHLTRVTNAVRTFDITIAPWPIADQSVDLCCSVAVLEHIPEESLPVVFAEMARVSKRGLHGVDLHDDGGFDKTHCSIHDLAWWQARMPPGQIPVDKEDLERGPVAVPGGTGVKLNVGCHTVQFHHGWTNVDLGDLGTWSRQHGYRYVRHDVTRGLWLDDGTVDLIYVSHFLEHFTYEQGAAILAEFRRVLKPGGVCRIIVPDAGVLMRKCAAGTLDDFDEVSPPAAARATQAGKLWELLVGGDHRAIYDHETLGAAMVGAGFSHVEARGVFSSISPVMQRETWDMFPDLSLIVEAVR